MEAWQEIRRQCRALRVAKKKTDRKREMHALDGLLTLSSHQAVLHRSGTWGFVVAQIFNVIEEDLLELTKKKKKGTMDLPLVNVLFHALDSARGSLVQNTLGIDTLRRLAVFGELGINDDVTIDTPVERYCYILLEKVLGIPAYCKILDPALLNQILGRVLTHLHLGTSPAHHDVCACIADHVIKNIALDLHPHLVKYMDFFNAWFGAAKATPTTAPIALHLLSCLVFLMEEYPAAMAPLVIDTTALAHVQRMLPHHLKALPSELSLFLLHYLRLVPSTDATHLCYALLDTATMNQTSQTTFSRARQSSLASTVAPSDTSLLGDRAIAWYSMVADVVWMHDHPTAIDASGERAVKRRRTTDALALVLDRIVDDSAATSSGSTATPSYSQMRSAASLETDVRRPPWLFLLCALLSRHGHWYQAHEPDALRRIRAAVAPLEMAAMDAPCRDVTCHLLLALVLRPVGEPASGWAAEVWAKTVADVSRRPPRDAALQLLAACVAVPHTVPPSVIEVDAPTLLAVAAANPMLPSALMLATVLWAAVDGVVPPETMRSVVAQAMRVLPSTATDDALPLLLLGTSVAAVCDGMPAWDVAPYLRPALSNAFAACGLQWTRPKALEIDDAAAPLSYLAVVYKGMVTPSPSEAGAAPSRLEMPAFAKELVLRCPRVLLDKMQTRVMLLPRRSPCVDKEHLSAMQSELMAVLHESMVPLATATVDELVRLLNRLLDFAITVASALGLHSGLGQHLEISQMLSQILTATSSRLTQLLKKEQYHVGLFQKLYSMLLVLQGSNLTVLTTPAPTTAKIKIPPSCRVAARDIVTMLETYVLSEAIGALHADMEDMVPDDLTDDGVTATTGGSSDSDALCRVWSLRIVLLLKKSDSSCHMVKTVVEQGYLSPLQALPLVPLLCHPLTPEGARVAVSLVKKTAKFAPELASAMLLEVGTHVVEPMPQDLLHDVLAVLEYQSRKIKHNRCVRWHLVQCWEAWYLVDVDVFAAFVETNLAHVVDADVAVRCAAVLALQTVYAKFEGSAAIYDDVYAHLLQHEADMATFVLACYVAGSMCPNLLPLVLSQCVENGRGESIVARSIAELSRHHGFASPWALIIDQLWGVLAAYLGLSQVLQRTADAPDISFLEFGLDLFDPALGNLATALESKPELVARLLPFAALVDAADNAADLVGSLQRQLPSLVVPDVVAASAQIAISALLRQGDTGGIETTPAVFRCVCEMGFGLAGCCPGIIPQLGFAALYKTLPHASSVVDMALCLYGIVGTTHLPSAQAAPLQCLCDCIDALGADVAGNVLAQRLLLRCLLTHVAQNVGVATVLKATVERFLEREPDAFGQSLNLLVQGIVAQYAAMATPVKSLVDAALVSVALHPKLHKHIAALDPVPLHVSPAIDQLATSCNSAAALGDSLATKLARPPLDTVPFTAFGLTTLDGVMAAVAQDQLAVVATVVYGLLNQAYQLAPVATKLVTRAPVAVPLEVVSLSPPSQQTFPSQLSLARSSSCVAGIDAPVVPTDYDERMVNLATCLGHLGAVFPASALQLDAGTLNTMHLHVHHRPSLAQLQAYKDSVLEVRAKLLEYLVGQLFGIDMALVAVAATTLRQLLALPQMHTALQSSRSLSSSVKTFLGFVQPAAESECNFPALPKRDKSAQGGESLDAWLAGLTEDLLQHTDDAMLRTCAGLLCADMSFATFLFPVALYTVLHEGQVISEVTDQLTGLLSTATLSQAQGQALVHAILYAQHLEKQSVKAVAASRLALPWLDVATVALRSELPYTALQYVERHMEATHGTIALVPEAGLVPLLRQIFDAIGDLDGLDGVLDAPRIADQAASYAMERKVASSLPLYDAALTVAPASVDLHHGTAAALHALGLTQLLRKMLQSDVLCSRAPSVYQYELAWQSMQWDLKEDASTFQGCVYGCLKGLVADDNARVETLLVQARSSLLEQQRVAFTGLETTKSLSNALVQLETLYKLEAVLRIQRTSVQQRVLGASALEMQAQQRLLLDAWSHRHAAYAADSDALLRVLSLEETLLRILDWSTALPQWHLKQVKVARKAHRPAIAYAALARLEATPLTPAARVAMLVEKAHVYYAEGDAARALLVAKHVHDELLATPQKEPLLLAQVQLTIGKWLASMRAERSEVIHTSYLAAATAIFERLAPDTHHGRAAAKAYLTVANYLFDNYQQVKGRVESTEWKRGKQVAAAQEQELHDCEQLPDHERNRYLKHIIPLRKQVAFDKAEREMVENSVVTFLTGALRNYGLCLRYAPLADMTPVFRIVSLWFEHGALAAVTDEMELVATSVPSYKLLPLSYQILSRLASSVPLPAFHRVLEALAVKMGIEHPHHTIVQLLALKNSGKQGNVQFRDNVGSGKAEAAARVLVQVQKHSSTSAELVTNMEVLCDAYVRLALFDTTEFVRKGIKKIAFANVVVGPHNVAFDQCLRLRRLNQDTQARPAVLTVTLAPRSDRDYTNVPRVQSFETTFAITDTGIHRPKIIYCFGSDGLRRKQLVKGNDDTRQDLVIEQTFEMVNSFLAEQPATKARHLRIKTYKVTPLGPIAGVLEWVENTLPVGNYLTSRGMDAHQRYHPHEWKHQVCRQHLVRATDKHRAFLEIQANFTPVFHHFFLEKYPDPANWYAKRVAYTRSVAVTSIVGHILGIGDRHSSNILIDEATGELVHIDFGVVFDQGTSTPETVPFRLTRDLVDGMGVTGVDGLFTRTCEETLKVLRKKGTALTTILEVFIHDPLYNWTLSPVKALRMQQESQLPMNKHGDVMPEENMADAASRALLRVKQKLQGYEDPTGDAMSVEGQVKRLIHVARDPHNLCKLYPGWGPWL
ncbi:phosphatidylinositol kinase (PIK-5) [Achlya hypogyna]|uniref:non-specific serine/threonine protein kinase n=1 Tax=Achlya hypogyna TaxID=1202772 RepID=A0A1V9YNC7_ACHHY|nr:phosphatidylinositol kinase (PIK-5) [Achlya hypogyna]